MMMLWLVLLLRTVVRADGVHCDQHFPQVDLHVTTSL
jgi:hypothetical protein